MEVYLKHARIFAFTTVLALGACNKTETPVAPAPNACQAQTEAAYAKGVNDSFGFLTKVRQGGVAKAGDYEVVVKGATGDEIASCISCGNMIIREGLKIIRGSSVTAVTASPAPAATKK